MQEPQSTGQVQIIEANGLEIEANGLEIEVQKQQKKEQEILTIKDMRFQF